MSNEPLPVTPPPPPPPPPLLPTEPYTTGYGYPASLPPMARLAYSTAPVQASRPGIITAIGVISIVVAAISLLTNLYTAGSLFMFSMMASYAGALGGAPFGPGAAPTVVAPTTAPMVQVAPEAPAVELGGMGAADRAAVAQGLSELEFLSAPRLEQLDTLLAKSGQAIFPELGEAPTPADVGNAVLGHGVSLSVDPGAPGPTFFRTKEGRFELYDDRAVFYPARGADVVRTSTLTTTNPGLTTAQVQAVVQQAQAASGNTLNPSQAAALNNLLSTPGQQFVSPITMPTAVRSAVAMGDGSVMVTFPNGFATFGPQGQTSSFTNNTTAAGGPMPFGGRTRINGAAMALAGFATVAGLGLAIYLLVIGIAVLRQSPRGRKFHLIYALLKIPVTILGAAGAWWLTVSYMESTLGSTGPMGVASGMVSTHIGMEQVVIGVFGLIYPIALLIALQTRAVKDYYDTVVT